MNELEEETNLDRIVGVAEKNFNLQDGLPITIDLKCGKMNSIQQVIMFSDSFFNATTMIIHIQCFDDMALKCAT